MAIAELDVAQLSSYCSLPQGSITTLLDAPTAELIRSLLENVSKKAREHSDLTSEKLKLGVELENAVRGGESKSRVLKGSIDKGLKEAADLKKRLQAEEAARASVETELENLKTSTSTSTSELSTLKTWISSLESSNRDTLSLLESKSTAYDNLAEELNAQHQKTIDLRREVSSLEQSVQSSTAASTSAKFHQQGLQQEIESLKRNNDWLDKELKTKSAEYTKYRKEKGLRIAELQRQYDEAISTIDASTRTETTLRRRLEEVSQKADDSFSRIQKMQEEAAKQNESFKVELDAANRLTELTRNSANTEKQRQQELFIQLESAKEDASEQLGRLGAELETEHREREAADAKIAELEVQIEQLQTDLSALQSQSPIHDATHHGINGFTVRTPARGASTPHGYSDSPSRGKGVLSVTQMYSDYTKIKTELDIEKRRSEQLSSSLDDMMQDLETRQPEIEELRADHSRLESEIAEMSSLLDVVGKERDQAVKSAKKWEGQVQGKIREGEVLRQQLRDLSSQVKVFLMEVNLRDRGLDDLSTESRAQLERLAQGEVDSGASEGVTATGKFISENLVTFRNIAELQERNTDLIRITREVGERMEHEEELRKQRESAQDWDDLQQKYERCKDEVKSLVTQSQSYIRERDMFRRMLAHRGQLPPGTDVSSLFGDSVNGDAAPTTPTRATFMNSIEDSPTAKDLADYAKLYKDMQEHFDSYRQEAATDRSTLKQQVDGLSKNNGELRSEIARSNSQVTLAHERYEMLQANYAMLKNENSELQKRSQHLSESAAKQDLRVQQVAEDLVEAKGLAESMRNETANLKAEKDFWKTIEKRITEDNESLLNERSRLNSLNSNIQNLLNEREHSDTEARRRLQTQIDNLEKDLQITKNKLSEETEENKRSALRREYDHEQSHKRIDDLVSSLGVTREELVAANTTRDHLSARVEELTIELRSAEERVNVLQDTSTARSNIANGENSQLSSAGGETNLSREQELAVQASELKRDLDLTKSELENFKGQVEQYKTISQQSEDELLSMNESHDLYRQETDKLINEKDSKNRELHQRIEDITSELDSTNSELSGLRNEQTEYARRLEEQKKAFEAELAQMKDQDDRHAAAAQYYEEDLKVQAQIAQQAQQNYENELVKHADAAKALQKARGDYNELKLEVVEVKTEAESARANLNQSEESWGESKEQYVRELAELRTGRESLAAQNNRLHQQLESITAQISSLKKRAISAEENPGEGPPASDIDNLNEVVKYLRREKDIVDVQLELSSQEAKRLKQQLDYTQSQLDETRLKLNQQRRADADLERSILDHNKLMDTVNELNTFRESNVTLRAEKNQAQSALATKAREIEELRAQIEPLQAEILELKNECEIQKGEARLLKENSDRWQQRAQNVLQKYDRVDPAELEALKEQLKNLGTERDELLSSKQSLQQQAENASSQITQVQEQSTTMKLRLTEQFKARSKTLSDRIKEKDSALQTAMTEKQTFEQRLAELSSVQSELETTRAERDAAIERASTQTAAAKSNPPNGSEDGQVDEGEVPKPTQEDLQSMRDRLSAAEARVNGAASESAGLQIQLATSQSKITELEVQIKEMQESIDSSHAELFQLRTLQEQPASAPPISDAEEQMEKLREDLAQALQDAENLRTTASMNASLASVPVEEGSKSIAEQVAEHVEAVRAELESRHAERVKQVDESLEKRTNNMKNNLTKKLTDGKNQLRQSLTAEHQQALQALKTEHEQEMEKLRVRHKDELDELKRHEDSRFASFRDVWEKENNAQPTIERQSSKAEAETPRDPLQLSEEEARALMKSNETLRNILRQNVANQVNKTRDEMSSHLKEEHEKALTDRITEVQNKANTAKEHAVLMEGKKNALQINMANNKAKTSQHKLDIIQKAVQENPQQPVQEVWLVAKDAKLSSVVVQQPQQDTSKGPKTPATTTFGQPTAVAISANQQIPDQVNASGQTSNASTFGRPTPAPLGSEVQQPGEQNNPSQNPAPTQPSSNSTNDNQRPPQQLAGIQPGSNLPQKPHHGAVNHYPNAGTGPGALRGLQQSGLPIARGGTVRGNANARGRGSGPGRGGPQMLDTNRVQGQSQGRGSPTSGGLNAGAKQFVPGNKRPRDEVQDQPGVEGGNGKRIRGGGGGS